MVRRRTGWTLVELLVVVSIITLLVAILMPTLGRARELTRRLSCKANLNAIGKAAGVYVHGSLDNQWMWFAAGTGWESTNTGTNRTTAPSGGNYNVSALLYMLVREGQSPAIFCCPSTSDTKEPDPYISTSPLVFAYDFSSYSAVTPNAEHVSYSFQCPKSDGTTGLDANTPTSTVAVADRTPTYLNDSRYNPVYNWGVANSEADKLHMSQNHSKGEITNLLYADFHVDDTARGNVGYSGDSIFTASGAAATNGSGGWANPGLNNHNFSTDTYLIGPKKN